LVVKVFDTPVAVFVTVTFTPGRTAPEESVTVPRMSPAFVLWARDAKLAKTTKRGRTHNATFFMYSLLNFGSSAANSIENEPSELLRL
jgi:hypothetical protein